MFSSSCSSCSVLSTLFKDGKYSDLTIKCWEREWKVHRNIVCTQSKPLAAAIDGDLQEAGLREVILEEDDPEMINLMLEFLYTGKINIDTAPPKSPFFYQQIQHIKSESGLASNDKVASFNPFARAATSTPSIFSPTPPTTSSVGNESGSNTRRTSIFGSASNTTPSQRFSSFGSPSISPDFRPHSIPAAFGATFRQPICVAPSTPAMNSSTHAKELPRLAKLYITAEKYNIQSLKDQVLTKFRDTLPETSLSNYFIESLKIIFDGIPETSPPDPFRTIAINAAGQNAKFLFSNQEFVCLCRDNAEFATQVLQASLGLGK